VNAVPTVEVQRVLDDRSRPRSLADHQKLSLDHPIMCYRGKVVFFFLPLDGLGPRLAML
jgi:hypothetical protein